MNRISDIKKSILWYHKSDDVWYHKFYFVISQIPTIFYIKKSILWYRKLVSAIGILVLEKKMLDPAIFISMRTFILIGEKN